MIWWIAVGKIPSLEEKVAAIDHICGGKIQAKILQILGCNKSILKSQLINEAKLHDFVKIPT